MLVLEISLYLQNSYNCIWHIVNARQFVRYEIQLYLSQMWVGAKVSHVLQTPLGLSTCLGLVRVFQLMVGTRTDLAQGNIRGDSIGGIGAI